MKLIGKAVLLGLAVATASVAACSNSPKSGSPTAQGTEDNTGSIGMKLQVAPGVTISTVHYTITNPTLPAFMGPLSGDVNVANSNGISFLIGGLPAGSGYTIALTATTNAPSDFPCSGSATFTVTAGASATATVNLVCTNNVDGGTIQPEASTGSVIVNADASVNTVVGTQNCGIVTSLSASPSEVNVGSTITLTAMVAGTGATLSWSTTGGMLSSTTASPTTFTCPSTAGTFTVTATANVAGSTCTNNTLSTTLTCDNVSGSSGSSSGSSSSSSSSSSSGGSSSSSSSSSGGSSSSGSSSSGGSGGPQAACNAFITANQGTFANVTNICSATELAIWEKVAGGSAGACLACSFNSGCLDDSAGDSGHECENVPASTTVPSTFTSLCLAALDCDLGVNTTTDTSTTAPAQPLVQNAYCGTASTSACASSQTGVCASQINAGFPGQTPTNILGMQGNRAFPAGMANAVVACELANCPSTCFP